MRLRPPDTRGGAAEDERNRDDEGEEETKGRGALCEWATPIGKDMVAKGKGKGKGGRTASGKKGPRRRRLRGERRGEGWRASGRAVCEWLCTALVRVPRARCVRAVCGGRRGRVALCGSGPCGFFFVFGAEEKGVAWPAKTEATTFPSDPRDPPPHQPIRAVREKTDSGTQPVNPDYATNTIKFAIMNRIIMSDT